MRQINKTSKVSEIVNSLTFDDNKQNRNMQNVIKQSTIFSFWEDIVGVKFARTTRPFLIRYSKLYVSAKSPIIAQELSLLKSKLIPKINSYSLALGIKVKDIIFDYKNYYTSETKTDTEDKPIWYSCENFKQIELDCCEYENIKKAVEKINFLDDTQKEKLISKICNAKKAQIKRNM